jgi:hypothetical protein
MKLALAWTANRLKDLFLKATYEDAVKLEWFVVTCLIGWLLMIFIAILK